jgi:uncharacterized membrane protein
MKLKYRIILFFFLLLWSSGIFAEWLIIIDEHLLILLPHFHKTYSLVCHQDKAKLIIGGHAETLVCARCTGIYLGTLFTSFIFLFKKNIGQVKIKFLFIASFPMLIDVLLSSLNVYHYSKLLAFLTGSLLGSVGFFYLYNGLKNLFLEIKSRV